MERVPTPEKDRNESTKVIRLRDEEGDEVRSLKRAHDSSSDVPLHYVRPITPGGECLEFFLVKN